MNEQGSHSAAELEARKAPQERCIKGAGPIAGFVKPGFMKPIKRSPFGHPGSFGAPGTRGSLGFCDPQAQLGFAYIPNRMGARFLDPRAHSLRCATYRAIGEKDPQLLEP